MGAVKNKSQNKKAKVNLISATIKNITGGLLEYTKEYLPGVTSVLEDSREIIEDVKKTAANSSGSVLSTFKSISRLISFKNLFDWYTDQGNQFGGDEDSFGDDLNFDIGGDSGDDSSSDELAKDLGTAEINEMKKSSDKVSKTVVETSQKMAELQVTSLAHITNSLEKTNSLITSGFESVNNSIKDLIKIVSENTASLIKIVSVGREEENTYYNNQKQFGMADLLRGGGFKAKDYFGYLKNKMSSTVGMAGTIFDMLGTLTSSPEMAMSMLQEQKKEWIGQGFHWIIEKAFPGFSRGLKNLERSVGDWFSSALIDLGKGKNPITGKPLEGWFRSIGEFFGVVGDFRGVGNLQLESFERKKISFDTETKESIVRIIPGYLREISTALGNVDKIYDYNKRSFVSTQDIKQQYQKEVADIFRVNIDTSKMQQYKKDANGNLVKDKDGKLIIEKQAFVKAYEQDPNIMSFANTIISNLMYRAANGTRDDIKDYYKKLKVAECVLDIDKKGICHGNSVFTKEVYEAVGIPDGEKTLSNKLLNKRLTYALQMVKAAVDDEKLMKELYKQTNSKTVALQRFNEEFAQKTNMTNSDLTEVSKGGVERMIINSNNREASIQNYHKNAKIEELKKLLVDNTSMQERITTRKNESTYDTKNKLDDFNAYLQTFNISSLDELYKLSPEQINEIIYDIEALDYNEQDQIIKKFKKALERREERINRRWNPDDSSHLINSGNISRVLKNSSSAGVGAAASSIRGASTTISSGITQLTSLLSGLGSLSASSPAVLTFSFDTDLTNFGNSYIEPIKDILTNYCATSSSDLVTKATEISLILNDIKTISSEIKTVNSDKIIFEDIKKLEEKGVTSLESIKTSVKNLESYSKSLTVPSTTPAPTSILPSGPIEVKIASDSITEMLDSFKAMVAANIPSGSGTTALVPVASSGGTVTAVPVTSQTLNPWQQLGSMLGFTSAPALPAPGATVSGTTAATAGVATAGKNIFTVVKDNLAQAGQRIATAVQQGAAKVQAMTMGGEYIENKLDTNGNVIGQVKVNVENGGIIGGAKDFLNKMIPSEGLIRDVFNKGKAWLLAPRPSTAKSAKGKEMDKKSEERRANLVTTVLGGLIGGSVGSLPGLVIGAMIGASEPISEIGFNFKEIVFGDLFDRQAKNPKMGLLEKGFVEFVLPFKLEVKKTWQHLWFYFKKDLLGPFQDMVAGFKNWAAKRKGKVLKSLLDWWTGTWFGQRIDKITRLIANFATGFGKNAWNFAKGFILKVIPRPIRAFSQAAMNLTGQVPKILNNAFSKWFGADFAEGARLNREKRLADLFKSLQKRGNLVGFNKNDKEFNELSESSEEFRKLMGSKSYREYYEKHPEFQDKNKMEAAILEDQRKWVQTRLQLKSILFGSSYVDSDSNPFSETLAAIRGEDGKGEGFSIIGLLKNIYGALNPNGANGGSVVKGENGESQVLNTDEYLKLLEESHKAGEIDEYTMNQAADRYKDNIANVRVIGNGTSADNIADALKEGKIDPSQAKAMLERINAKETDQSAKDENTRIVNNGIALFNAAKNNEQKANGPVENPIIKFFKGIWDFSIGWVKELFRGTPGLAMACGVLPGLVLNADKIAKWASDKFLPKEESDKNERNRETKDSKKLAQNIAATSQITKQTESKLSDHIRTESAKGKTPEEIRNEFRQKVEGNTNLSAKQKTEFNNRFDKVLSEEIITGNNVKIGDLNKKVNRLDAQRTAIRNKIQADIAAIPYAQGSVNYNVAVSAINKKYNLNKATSDLLAAKAELNSAMGQNAMATSAIKTKTPSQFIEAFTAGEMEGMMKVQAKFKRNIAVTLLKPLIIEFLCLPYSGNQKSKEAIAWRDGISSFIDVACAGFIGYNTVTAISFDIPKIYGIRVLEYLGNATKAFFGAIGEKLAPLAPWNWKIFNPSFKPSNSNAAKIATEWNKFLLGLKKIGRLILGLFNRNTHKHAAKYIGALIEKSVAKCLGIVGGKIPIVNIATYGATYVWGLCTPWEGFEVSDEIEKFLPKQNATWRLIIQSYLMSGGPLGLMLADHLSKGPESILDIMRTTNGILNTLSWNSFLYCSFEMIADIVIPLLTGGAGMEIKGLKQKVYSGRALILWSLFGTIFGAGEKNKNLLVDAANKGFDIFNENIKNSNIKVTYQEYLNERSLVAKGMDVIKGRQHVGNVITDGSHIAAVNAQQNRKTLIDKATGKNLIVQLNGESAWSNQAIESTYKNRGYVMDSNGQPMIFDGGERIQYKNDKGKVVTEAIDLDKAFVKINPFAELEDNADSDIIKYRIKYRDLLVNLIKFLRNHRQEKFIKLLKAVQTYQANEEDLGGGEVAGMSTYDNYPIETVEELNKYIEYDDIGSDLFGTIYTDSRSPNKGIKYDILKYLLDDFNTSYNLDKKNASVNKIIDKFLKDYGIDKNKMLINGKTLGNVLSNYKNQDMELYKQKFREGYTTGAYNDEWRAANSDKFKQQAKNVREQNKKNTGDSDQESNGVSKDKQEEGTGAIAPVATVPNSNFIYPVENYSKNMLVSDFYNNRGDHIHGGVDIAANAGTGIRAASDGWLVHKGWENPNNHGQGYGYFLVIKDPKSGNKYIYGHMQKFSKEIDQLPLHGQIKKGTYLGEMGSTGHSTGPHLHFEIRKGAPGEGDDYGTEARAVDVSTALATRYDPIKYLEDNGVASAPTDKNNQISEGSIADLSGSEGSSNNLLNELLGFDKIGALINKFLGDLGGSKAINDKGSPYISSDEGFIDTSKYKFNKVKGEKISISKKKQEVASKVYNVLRAKGFSHTSAAAVLGNLWQESTLRPDVVNSIGAAGIAQWLDPERRGVGRRSDLEAFAKKYNNGVWEDPEIQARFLAYELSQGKAFYGNKNYYVGDFNDMDLDKATVMWRRSFERCDESEANDENRLLYAHYFDKAFAKNSGGESPFEQLNFLRYRNLLNHNKNLRFKSQLSSKLSQFPVELSNLQNISNVSNINSLLPQLATKETASKKEDSLELKQIAQLLMKVIEVIEAGNMLKSSELKNKITDATQMNNIVRQFENNIKTRTAKFKTTQPFNSPFPTAISSLVLGI